MDRSKYELPGRPCQQCGGARLVEVAAHARDSHSVDTADRHYHGYMLWDMGVGGGDLVHIVYCLDCGRLRGQFPLPPTEIERGEVGDRVTRNRVAGPPQ